ncbi:beta-N-acetylhexosaminidase [Capnocytophaga cynodegmi]|uniref:beta-N-acetylhexosaminidase n=1 Tax=Capnocytophaga cynodegmi TaxID=28189 RepID=UPI00385E765E
MSKKKFFILIGFVWVSFFTYGQNVIPLPESYLQGEGYFELSKTIKVVTNLPKEKEKPLEEFINKNLIVSNIQNKNSIIELKVTQPEKEEEAWNNTQLQAYTLSIGIDTIKIQSPTSMGLFYGLQTLRQLTNNGKIHCAEISDKPKFRHRGLMIDCSRHFWSKEFIKKQIDAMTYLKLNRLHLHLVDGGGWRIEITKYPDLINKTAYRTSSDWDKKWKYCYKDTPNAYGGYYTKDDIREIVTYAQKNYITVIPEIEMPGHSNEVIYAYPELSCTGKGDGFDLCIGNPKTYVFLTEVLQEVMELFPSEYIHVGGDEASMMYWKKCPKCMTLYKEKNMTEIIQLQSYLMARIDEYLTKKGRKMMGWDEILEGNQVSPGATVLSWRGETGGVTAAKLRHHAVMSPSEFCYLDQYQDNPSTQPKAFGGYVPLEKVYSYDPIPTQLKDTEYTKYIDGIQGNLWTEYVETEQHAEYMIYPRITAIAEVGWGYKSNYTEFKQRVVKMMQMLKSLGYNSFDITKEVGK